MKDFWKNYNYRPMPEGFCIHDGKIIAKEFQEAGVIFENTYLHEDSQLMMGAYSFLTYSKTPNCKLFPKNGNLHLQTSESILPGQVLSIDRIMVGLNTWVKESKIQGDGIFFNGLRRIESHYKGHRLAAGAFINHSDSPNCILEQDGDFHYILVSNIVKVGQELTLDYIKEGCDKIPDLCRD